MLTNERPILQIKKTSIDFAMEYGVLIALLFLWVYTFVHYKRLPENIPVHFNNSGNADSFGSKNSLWLLPVIVTMVVMLLRFISRHTHKFNHATTITNENSAIQYKLSLRLLRFLQVSLTVLFAYIIVKQIKGAYLHSSALGWWFIPLLLAVILFPAIYVVYSSTRKK